MLNRQRKWRCYKNSNLPVNPESHTHSLVLLSQYPLTHSVIQVWILQLEPVHPASQTQSSFESQWPWKLHFPEQSLVMLKRENKMRKLMTSQTYCQVYATLISATCQKGKSTGTDPSHSWNWQNLMGKKAGHPISSTPTFNFKHQQKLTECQIPCTVYLALKESAHPRATEGMIFVLCLLTYVVQTAILQLK